MLDGGSGSNFLTGGAGRDDFFLDGRGGTITWAIITDWQANERLSVWRWQLGISRAYWVDGIHSTGNGSSSPGSVTPSGCRTSRIASTMSGASSVSRSTRET